MTVGVRSISSTRIHCGLAQSSSKLSSWSRFEGTCKTL